MIAVVVAGMFLLMVVVLLAVVGVPCVPLEVGVGGGGEFYDVGTSI